MLLFNVAAPAIFLTPEGGFKNISCYCLTNGKSRFFLSDASLFHVFPLFSQFLPAIYEKNVFLAETTYFKAFSVIFIFSAGKFFCMIKTLLTLSHHISFMPQPPYIPIFPIREFSEFS